MKKFRVNYSTRIKELEVIKETDKQIVYKREDDGREVREAKVSDCASWYETKEDAINFMVSKQQLKIDEYLKQIEYCQEKIETIRSLLNVV